MPHPGSQSSASAFEEVSPTVRVQEVDPQTDGHTYELTCHSSV